MSKSACVSWTLLVCVVGATKVQAGKRANAATRARQTLRLDSPSVISYIITHLAMNYDIIMINDLNWKTGRQATSVLSGI